MSLAWRVALLDGRLERLPKDPPIAGVRQAVAQVKRLKVRKKRPCRWVRQGFGRGDGCVR